MLKIRANMITGWWYTYPSEKYDSQLGLKFHKIPNIWKVIKNVPNHQPDKNHENPPYLGRSSMVWSSPPAHCPWAHWPLPPWSWLLMGLETWLFLGKISQKYHIICRCCSLNFIMDLRNYDDLRLVFVDGELKTDYVMGITESCSFPLMEFWIVNFGIWTHYLYLLLLRVEEVDYISYKLVHLPDHQRYEPLHIWCR